MAVGRATSADPSNNLPFNLRAVSNFVAVPAFPVIFPVTSPTKSAFTLANVTSSLIPTD